MDSPAREIVLVILGAAGFFGVLYIVVRAAVRGALLDTFPRRKPRKRSANTTQQGEED